VRLVLLDYLRSMRERAELEDMIPRLLRAMHWTILSSPQAGVRQGGVDIAAVGTDPDDGIKRLFLLVIKSGDIGRAVWQGNTQAIRPSLEEIFDSYLPERVPSEYQNLPIKILLVTGGCLKQEVSSDWAGFTRKHSEPSRQFAFWGGDELSGLIESHLLNERLFPETCRSAFRKVLALAGTRDGISPHFVALANELLGTKNSLTISFRGIRTINLSLRILLRWCDDLGNLNEAWLCSERALLLCWEWGRVRKQLNRKAYLVEFSRLYETYLITCGKYVNKLVPYCLVPDGLSKGMRCSAIEYHLWTQEVLGRLAVYGLNLMGAVHALGADKNLEALKSTAWLIKNVLENHPIAKSPIYDDQSIEVAMALTVLLASDDTQEYAKQLLREIIDRIHISYKYVGCHYPMDTENFDDLLNLQFGENESKEEHTRASTLFPILADFCLIYNQQDAYKELATLVKEVFPHTCLQLWFPDEATDERLYVADAGLESGSSYTCMKLPETLEELSSEIAATMAFVWDSNKLSCFEKGMPIMAWLSARHYRTPPVPLLWRRLIPDTKCEKGEGVAQDTHRKGERINQ